MKTTLKDIQSTKHSGFDISRLQKYVRDIAEEATDKSCIKFPDKTDRTQHINRLANKTPFPVCKAYDLVGSDFAVWISRALPVEKAEEFSSLIVKSCKQLIPFNEHELKTGNDYLLAAINLTSAADAKRKDAIKVVGISLTSAQPVEEFIYRMKIGADKCLDVDLGAYPK